jgi:hypothetical protein
MALHASGMRDTRTGLARQYQHGYDGMKKKAPALQHVNQPL